MICGILVIGTIIGVFMVRPDLGKGLVGGLSVGHLPSFPEWAPPDAVKNPLLTMAKPETVIPLASLHPSLAYP